MVRKSLVLAAAVLSGAALATPAAAQNEQFVPILSYRTGAYAVNGVPYANGVVGLLQPGQRARRRHQRRQAPGRGMRDRLRHRQGRGVLRAPEGQGPDRRGVLQPAVDRHHLRADREDAGRQDPDHHHGLRPRRLQERRGVRLELPAARHLLVGGRHRHPARRQGARRRRQAEGQEDQPRLSRQPLRQGADPGAAGAGGEARLRVHADPGHASGRRAEVAVARHPPEPARLRAALGLGRDERHRHQGSGGRRLSARQDDRRVVVGCRARRDAGRRSGHRLQGAHAPARRRQVQGARRHREARLSPRARALEQGETSARCSTTAAWSTPCSASRRSARRRRSSARSR